MSVSAHFLLPLRHILRPLQHTRAFSATSLRPIAKITVVGRLAAPPELVTTSGGQDVIRYALGTNYGPRDNQRTSWWKVGCFAPGGRFKDLLLGLGKGSLVYLEGDATMQKVLDKDGNTQSLLRITQRNLEILEKRDSESRSEGEAESRGEAESEREAES